MSFSERRSRRAPQPPLRAWRRESASRGASGTRQPTRVHARPPRVRGDGCEGRPQCHWTPSRGFANQLVAVLAGMAMSEARGRSAVRQGSSASCAEDAEVTVRRGPSADATISLHRLIVDEHTRTPSSTGIASAAAAAALTRPRPDGVELRRPCRRQRDHECRASSRAFAVDGIAFPRLDESSAMKRTRPALQRRVVVLSACRIVRHVRQNAASMPAPVSVTSPRPIHWTARLDRPLPPSA